MKQQQDEKSELEEKIRRRQQKLDKLGQQIQELKARVVEKQTRLEKQDKVTTDKISETVVLTICDGTGSWLMRVMKDVCVLCAADQSSAAGEQ